MKSCNMVLAQPTQACQEEIWIWFFHLLKPLHRLLMHLYFRVEITGWENLPTSPKGIILAPKHSSRWDPLLLALLSPRPFRYIATRTEFKGLQGWMMRRLGAIPLDTEDPSTSTFRKAEALLQAGETVVIFPEGGIHPHSLAPLKPGLSRLVVRLERKYQYEIPVVPIAISYSPADQRGAHARVEILATLRTATWRETGNGKNTPAADKTVAAAMTRQLSLSLSSPLHQSPVEQQQSDVRPWQNKAL